MEGLRTLAGDFYKCSRRRNWRELRSVQNYWACRRLHRCAVHLGALQVPSQSNPRTSAIASSTHSTAWMGQALEGLVGSLRRGGLGKILIYLPNFPNFPPISHTIPPIHFQPRSSRARDAGRRLGNSSFHRYVAKGWLPADSGTVKQAGSGVWQKRAAVVRAWGARQVLTYWVSDALECHGVRGVDSHTSAL